MSARRSTPGMRRHRLSPGRGRVPFKTTFVSSRALNNNRGLLGRLWSRSFPHALDAAQRYWRRKSPTVAASSAFPLVPLFDGRRSQVRRPLRVMVCGAVPAVYDFAEPDAGLATVAHRIAPAGRLRSTMAMAPRRFARSIPGKAASRHLIRLPIAANLPDPAQSPQQPLARDPNARDPHHPSPDPHPVRQRHAAHRRHAVWQPPHRPRRRRHVRGAETQWHSPAWRHGLDHRAARRLDHAGCAARAGNR